MPSIKFLPDGTPYVRRSDVDYLLHDIAALVRNGQPVAIERGVPGKKIYDLRITAGPDGVHPWPDQDDEEIRSLYVLRVAEREGAVREDKRTYSPYPPP